MIIVKLIGGLGNQMFQYAAGRALSLKYHTDLFFDLSLLNADSKNQYTKRELALNVFNFELKEAGQTQLSCFFNPTFFFRLKRKLMGNAFPKYLIADQQGFEYKNDFEGFPKNTYLNGYWQSEKFFKAYREILLKELTLKKEKTEKVLETEKLIRSCNAVSIHIRRGDYVSSKSASEVHGVMPLEYYEKAVAYMKSKDGHCQFFIFSDDMAWVKENLKIDATCRYIDFNTGDNSVFDMYLMSICNHHIIANSSFSWWGAWLNQKADKIVIAPKRWFQDDSLNTKDLLPEEWIKM